jgi:hypothetical protein
MLVTVVLCFPAHADYPWMFAQVVCAPTLGYFSIRRITIMNLPDKHEITAAYVINVRAVNHVLKEVTHIGSKDEGARRVGRTA